MDPRSRTLRSLAKRDYALSGQLGKGTAIGGNVAFRKVSKGVATSCQIVRRQGTYIKMSNWCLTPHGWTATEDKALTWYHCQNRNEQKWESTMDLPRTWGTVREFRLRQLADKRYSVYMSKYEQGPQSFIAKLSSRRKGAETQFFMDPRTRTLRNYVMRDYAISGQFGQGTKMGGHVAFRKVNRGRASTDQVVRTEGYYRGFYLKMSNWCLTPLSWRAREDRLLTWYQCKNSNYQKWTIQWLTKWNLSPNEALRYLQNNSDLAKAFGAGDWRRGKQHWADHGYSEGRMIPDYITSHQARRLLGKYRDLRQAFGTNW